MNNPVVEFYQKTIGWLRSRISRVQLIIVIAALVGLCSGLVAVLLKSVVHILQELLIKPDFPKAYLLLPVIGLLLSASIIQFFFRSQLERGIALVLRSIARGSSYIPPVHTYIQAITSSFTVGLGGSAGLEAPIVATGSAWGSNIARISDLSYSERSLLIACGAAAGIAAVFNAPVAGVMFAVEVLLTEMVVSHFIPLVIAAVIGALCSKVILHEDSLFNFILKEQFHYKNVPFYLGLGVLSGFISLYYARVFKQTEHLLSSIRIPLITKAIIGGGALAACYYLFPPLFGEGYVSVKQVASNSLHQLTDNTTLLARFPTEWAILIFTGCIVLLKPVASGITLGSGGNGGNFAPSLFTGAFLGYFFSRLINHLQDLWRIPVGNFSLVGMAGVLSGVMYCPLTAVFLIAEITNGYGLMIPLMLVSIISYFIVKSYQPYSMDIRKLAQEGQIFTQHKEKNMLQSISLESMLQDTYESIAIDRKLTDLIELIKTSEKNIFAVVDQRGRFAGIIELNDVKQKIFNPDEYPKTSIKSLMKKPAAVIRVDQEMQSVMHLFDLSQSWYLPVLDADRRFVGFISKTKLFNKYREILAASSDLYESPEHPSTQ